MTHDPGNGSLQVALDGITDALDHPMTDILTTQATPPIMMWTIGAVVNCAAGSTLSMLTFLGQIMVFVVVAHNPRLQTPSNYFITSLAISDFVISILCMPMWTVYHTLGYWPFSQLLCDIWHAVDFIVCTVSIYTIVFMSVDRYCSLRYPLTYSVKRTPKKAKLALVGIWLGATVIMGPFILVTQNIYGKVRIEHDCPLYYLVSIPLVIGECVLVLWGTVIVTCLVYVRVFFLVRKAGKVNQTLTAGQTKAGHDSKQDKEDDKQGKAFRTIILLLATFAICFLPASIILVVVTLKPGAISFWWLVGSYWVAYGNSFLNPLCYAVGNPHFKDTLYRLVRSSRKPDVYSKNMQSSSVAISGETSLN